MFVTSPPPPTPVLILTNLHGSFRACALDFVCGHSHAADGAHSLSGVDIMEFGDHIVAYTQCDDLLMFVTGLASENELILAEVLGSLDEALNMLLRGLVYEENVLLHLQGVLLVIDELVDQEGVIMESDPAELALRAGGQANSFAENVPMGEQTLSQALQIAKDQIARSILQG